MASSLAHRIDSAANRPRAAREAPATIARVGIVARGKTPSARPTMTAHQITNVAPAITLISKPPSASARPVYASAIAAVNAPATETLLLVVCFIADGPLRGRVRLLCRSPG